MKNLNRRTVLRGLGGLTLGLPWLEAMAQSSFSPNNVRLAYLFFPNGVIPEHWTPGRGKLDKLPKTLSPLEPIKKMVNVHTGLAHPTKYSHVPGVASFLSGAEIKKGVGELGVGQSTDILAAEHLGKYTSFSSLELSLVGTLGSGLEHGYIHTMGAYISWLDKRTPLPRERVPLNAYHRLFKGSRKSVRTPEETNSLLDFVKEDVIAMKRSLGKEDLYRIDQYFSSIRSLEKRILKATKGDQPLPRDAKKPQSGIPKDARTYSDLMLDIMVLAFQTNRTKVASLMLGLAWGHGLNFDFLGVRGGIHNNSHHNNDPTKIKHTEAVTRFHVGVYSKFLQKLQAVKEGDKTLLDNSLVLLGSDLWDGNKHSSDQRAILVGGKGGGSVSTGNHILHAKGKPLNNLYVGMMKTAGCPVSKFGNSTGALI